MGSPAVCSDVLLWYDEYHTPLDLLAEHLNNCLVVDIDLGGSARRAPLAAATGLPVSYVDAVAEFAEEYLLRAIKAQARYQDGYLLSAALSRPLIAQHAARIAESTGARRIIHGCAGNDQLRLELALRVLVPDVEVVPAAALIGSQNLRNKGKYSVSDNIWGRSCEAAELSDPARVANSTAFTRTCAPEAVVADYQRHRLEFVEGRPVALDDEHATLAALIERVDRLAADFGVGVTDVVEDGFVGLKGRAIYEAPAATVLLAAHADLQRIVCSRRQSAAAQAASTAWTDLIYDGQWFDPARQSLEALLDDVNRCVTGEVTLLFRHGSAVPISRSSPFALYDDSRAIYRVGQDVAADLQYLVEALSGPMQVARQRKV